MKKIILSGCAIGATATTLAVFTAPGFGGEDPKTTTGPPVHKTTMKAPTGGAQAARRFRRFRKIGKFSASSPTFVPADGASQETILSCPRRSLAIAGGYDSDGFITADTFLPQGRRKWVFRFVDLVGLNGQATEWIICVK